MFFKHGILWCHHFLYLQNINHLLSSCTEVEQELVRQRAPLNGHVFSLIKDWIYCYFPMPYLFKAWCDVVIYRVESDSDHQSSVIALIYETSAPAEEKKRADSALYPSQLRRSELLLFSSFSSRQQQHFHRCLNGQNHGTVSLISMLPSSDENFNPKCMKLLLTQLWSCVLCRL